MDQKFLAVLVRELLEAGLKRVDVMEERGGPLDDWYCLYSPQSRITLCLSGARHYALSRGGRVEEIEQGARQCVYSPPNSWLRFRPVEPYEAFSVTFFEDAMFFAFSRFDGSERAKEDFPMRTIVTRVSVPVALDEAGHILCRSLLHAGAVPHISRRSGVELLLCKALDALESENGSQSRAQFSWQAAAHFIEENCARPLTRDDVAAFLRMHPNHVSRLFSRQGESFASYLLRVRLERARRLLQDPTLNVSSVARLSGFVNANYFIRTFKARYGFTPGRARGG